MQSIRVLFFVLLSAVFTFSTYAHGGGLNAEGCHRNHKTGDYHCHRPKVEKQDKARSVAPAAPTCYIGPKGGTYTITPSGKKNYKGCQAFGFSMANEELHFNRLNYIAYSISQFSIGALNVEINTSDAVLCFGICN